MTFEHYRQITDRNFIPISYTWEILPESTDLGDGGDFEKRPKTLENLILNENNGELTFKTPTSGSYRLFIYADDGHGHAATSNIPFKVN